MTDDELEAARARSAARHPARIRNLPPLTTHELNVLARAVGERLNYAAAVLATIDIDEEQAAYWTEERATLMALNTAIAETMGPWSTRG